MPMVICPDCHSGDNVWRVRDLDNGQKVVECRACSYEWTHGQAKVSAAPIMSSFAAAKHHFPKPEDVDPDVKARADALKKRFLTEQQPQPGPNVAPAYEHWRNDVFSREGLGTADPQEFKDFANSNVGANPGNMSVFNRAWNEMGAEAGAESVRKTIGYLLHGPEKIPLEDRLTELIHGTKPYSMTGFKEALLTKVLCVMEPQRFVSILMYTGTAGKREVARAVYGLELPSPHAVTTTIGRLIVWSNDLLRSLGGDGFVDQQHAAQFLWWAKDQPGGPAA